MRQDEMDEMDLQAEIPASFSSISSRPILRGPASILSSRQRHPSLKPPPHPRVLWLSLFTVRDSLSRGVPSPPANQTF